MATFAEATTGMVTSTTYTPPCVCVCMYICIYACIYPCMYACMYVSIMFACVYACIQYKFANIPTFTKYYDVCTYVYIYTYVCDIS